jgi:ADP-ribosyltransferase exoenzyme
MVDYISKTDIIKSYEHFMLLSTEERELLTQYKGELEDDDWKDFAGQPEFSEKGPLNYVVINFLLKTNLDIPLRREPPKLIKRLTLDHWKKQIISCADLIYLLYHYPKSKEEHILYRGQPQYDFYEGLSEGKTFVVEPFYSTTLNIQVAKNFGHRTPTHLIKIIIPKNTILPFISERLTLEPNIEGGSESEILLPPNCSYQYMGKTMEHDCEVYNIRLVDVPKISRSIIVLRKYMLDSLKPKAEEIHGRYYKEREEEEDEEGSGKKKKKSKRKKKNRNTRRKYKKKLIYKKNIISSIYARWI